VYGWVQQFGGGVYISSDGGADWNLTSFPYQYVTSLCSYGGNIYGGTDAGDVYTSSDGGITWTGFGLPSQYFASIGVSGPIIAVGTFAGYPVSPGAYLSTDSGTTWNIADTSLEANFVTSFAFSGGNLFAGSQYNGVRLTTDNGAHWSSAGLTFTQVYTLLDTNGYLIAGTDSGVFVSSNNGAHWIAKNTGLRDLSVNRLTFFEGYMYAGTGNTGVWRRSFAELTDVHEKNTPSEFAFSQNYPNPFSASTTISFSLSESTPVTLRVYNALGEEVATLINGEMDAGLHNATFNGEKLQNGMYFYRLTAGKDSQDGEMAVIH